MRNTIFTIAILFSYFIATAQNTDSVFIRKIYTQALTKAQCYENLKHLCKNIGPRLSGTTNAEKALTYGCDLMSNIGISKTYKQPVTVPHWIRGAKEESFIAYSDDDFIIDIRDKLDNTRIKQLKRKELAVCALGGSISTPEEGITAPVIEVSSYKQLDSLGKENIEGKIVFYNKPMNTTMINTFDAYGDAVQFRGRGAIQAAKYGAVAVLVRSVTTSLDDYPHTGAMRYIDGTPKIPACAISTNDAEWLHNHNISNSSAELTLKMYCETLPDVESANAIGEITGTELPNEFIIVGGHIDSWDLAEGAHDDGAGVVQSIEAIRILKMLGYAPKHSIRCVLFMNEENGLRGGIEYAKRAKEKNEKHIAAIESDAGGFAPIGFASEGNTQVKQQLLGWKNLFAPYNLTKLTGNGGGADISSLKEQGCALYELEPESQRYFDVHHSALDVFETVNKRELELGAASLATLIYLLDKYSE